MPHDRPSGLAYRAALERRYDVLPPWAWRRQLPGMVRLEAQIGALESLIRETDRALEENVARIELLRARHRRRRAAFARSLARNRALLGLLVRLNGAAPRR